MTAKINLLLVLEVPSPQPCEILMVFYKKKKKEEEKFNAGRVRW